MAITNGYCTTAELAGFTGASYDNRNTLNAELAIEAASRQIDRICQQFFYDTSTATARVFRLDDYYYAKVDPFHTTTGLLIKTDTNGDGTYATTWSASDYELAQFGGLNAYELNGPYDTIYSGVGSQTFGSYTLTRRQYPLQVTARWGWAAVPSDVKRACLVLASEMMKDPDTPFGVAGFDQFGAVRVRANPRVETALAPYVRWDRRAGIA